MEPKARKIAIHIRTQKRVVETHAHKRAKAHKHSHEHDGARREVKRKELERNAQVLGGKRLEAEADIARVKTEHSALKETIGHAEQTSATLGERRGELEAKRLRILEERAQALLRAQKLVVPVPQPTPPALSRKAQALVPSKLIIPKKPIITEGVVMSAQSVAYFCMEMGIDRRIPTYAGGLGILAGDMMRSSADLKLDTIGVTLLYTKGYFHQRLDDSGWQVEEPERWDPFSTLILLPQLVEIELEGRTVTVRAWLYKVVGEGGHVNPLIFLDTNFAKNTPEDRMITNTLYVSDRAVRLKQEAILGIAGVRMLSAIGATNVQKFHMNEGHSSLLTLELYRQYRACDDPVVEVRQRCVFTTHTPVAAGHDRFSRTLALSLLGDDYIPSEILPTIWDHDELNMTHLGMMFSSYINGVAKKHGEVARELFPGYRIESITNGVHVPSWVAPEIATLLTRYIPGWRADAYNLRYTSLIPAEELWGAHQEVKSRMCARINATHPGAQFSPDIFTIGFARRATSYKRGNMLFRDMERLKHIAGKHGGIQVVYAGKAHPDDRDGKLIIQQIIREMGTLNGSPVRAVYLPNYDMELAGLLVAGSDVWLNTPMRPLEASGTSGMKASLNGVLHVSTLDGWWLEGHIENVTGWAIGPHPEVAIHGGSDQEDIEDLYTKLEYIILPKYNLERHGWIKMMRSAIAINGSFFNTQRMVEQYVLGAYFK